MTVKRLRQAAVAGYFYPETPDELREELRRLTQPTLAKKPSSGAIIPHAGYQYSGAIAGETLSRLAIPSRCIILGPNHTGWGAPWSLMCVGAYATPLGEVPIDEPLARALLDDCPLFEPDELAHKGEHAVEVELPFLQWLGPGTLRFVPLVIGSHDPEEFEQAAESLARVIRDAEDPVLLLASSDFTHYEPRDVASEKDHRVIEAIRDMNVEQFLGQVRELNVTMCGFAPVACVLGATKRLGASGAELVRYGTSADAGGDPHSVVGYAGIILN